MVKKTHVNPTRFRHPGRVVNICFLVVLLCSPLLTWREILVTQNTTLRISGSPGVSGITEEGTYDFEQLQSVADRRLYLVRQKGRNQICARD